MPGKRFRKGPPIYCGRAVFFAALQYSAGDKGYFFLAQSCTRNRRFPFLLRNPVLRSRRIAHPLAGNKVWQSLHRTAFRQKAGQVASILEAKCTFHPRWGRISEPLACRLLCVREKWFRGPGGDNVARQCEPEFPAVPP